jgi:hypothetical protein
MAKERPAMPPPTIRIEMPVLGSRCMAAGIIVGLATGLAGDEVA